MEFIKPSTMKWSGWGQPFVTFPIEDKPDLWPFVRNKLGLKRDLYQAPINLKDIQIPDIRLSKKEIKDLKNLFGDSKVSTDFFQRLTHAFGKSFPDLWRVRHGFVPSAPDAVIWPESHEEVIRLVQWSRLHEVHLIPFGGGTNIVNALEVKPEALRPVLSVDMRLMNKLLSIDPESNLALLEAGAPGPQLEAQLEKHGFSLGHFPDSFEFSTLGGWIATRSAGMQSDAYGRIEDMVASLHVVAADHILEMKPFPATSAGPALTQNWIGSEGCFGIITQAWMKIHKIPEQKNYEGFLFRHFKQGLAAIQACHQAGLNPSLIRLQDEGETELAFHLKSPRSILQSALQIPIKKLLKSRGYTKPVLLVIGFEGAQNQVQHCAKAATKILKNFGAFSLGSSIGNAWSKDKYNMPYLRDYLMDYGCIADVAETATSWSNLESLHTKVLSALEQAAHAEGLTAYFGCHLSHTYSTGGCLYFTWAILGGDKTLERYYRIKAIVTDAIVTGGGTLSHHHAVGTEHLPWLAQELGPGGSALLGALKKTFDPTNMFNPGGLSTSRIHPYLGGPRERQK